MRSRSSAAVLAVGVVAFAVAAGCSRPTPRPGSEPDQPSLGEQPFGGQAGESQIVAGQPGAGQQAAAQPSPTPLVIVTVAEAVADVVRHLAPDADVTALWPGDPAAFAPGPDEQAQAAAAPVVVASESELVALGVADRPRPGSGGATQGGGGATPGGGGATPGSPGPVSVALPGDALYGWLNPSTVQTWLPPLREALTTENPADAAEYESAAARLQLELVGLADMEAISLAAIPDERMSFAVDAPGAVESLATRLGLTAVGLADGVETVAQAEAMSSEDLAAAIAAADAPMVYLAAPGNHARVAELARISGRPIGLLFAVNPSPDDGPAPGYLGMMRFNVRSLFEGLSPPDADAP